MRRVLLVLIWAIGIWSSFVPAHARSKILVLPQSDMSPVSPDALTSQKFITLPNDDSESVSVGLTLPADFKKNTGATLKVYFMSTESAPCDIVFLPMSITRMRRGLVYSPQNAVVGGFTNASDSPKHLDRDHHTLYVQNFRITPMSTGTVVGHRPFDTFRLGFIRKGSDQLDTCDESILLVSARLSYKVRD